MFHAWIWFDADGQSQFVVSMLASLHLQVLSVVMFNGLNFLDWCEQVSFHLNVLNLDLTLQIEKPIAIIDSNSDEHRS